MFRHNTLAGVLVRRLGHWLMINTGAYPGGRTPGGPSESLILAPSELKNVALSRPPPR